MKINLRQIILYFRWSLMVLPALPCDPSCGDRHGSVNTESGQYGNGDGVAANII